MNKNNLLFLIFIILIAMGCSSDDYENKLNEDKAKEYLDRSKQRIKPLLDEWILGDIKPSENFKLAGFLNNSFVRMQFRIKGYASYNDVGDVISSHRLNLFYVYKDNKGLSSTSDLIIDLWEINKKENNEEYTLYFKFRIYNNKYEYIISFSDEKSLLLSYTDENNIIHSQRFIRSNQ